MVDYKEGIENLVKLKDALDPDGNIIEYTKEYKTVMKAFEKLDLMETMAQFNRVIMLDNRGQERDYTVARMEANQFSTSTRYNIPYDDYRKTWKFPTIQDSDVKLVPR